MKSARRVSRAFVLALSLCVAATSAFGQEKPGRERGFKPEQAYDFTNIDTVNLFNGNLQLAIPLGQSYPVAAGLSYQFVLRYSGNVWHYSEWMKPAIPKGEDSNGWSCVDYGSIIRCGKSAWWAGYIDNSQDPSSAFWFPHRDNAGLGWRVSFGELDPPPSTDTPPPVPMGTWWRYKTPDGGEHAFYKTLHDPICSPTIETQCDPESANVFYTRDGSYLRLVAGKTTGDWIVEFPEGRKQLFRCESTGGCTLQYIYNQHSQTHATTGIPTTSYVKFSYDDAGNWTVQDSNNRTHYVTMHSPVPYRGINRVVTKVDLQSVGEQRAAFELNHETTTDADGNTLYYTAIPKPCGARIATARVRLLSSVNFPSGETYAFRYRKTPEVAGEQCENKSGTLETFTLPTGGTVEYKYKPYTVDAAVDAIGVDERTVKDATGNVLQRTDYSSVDASTVVEVLAPGSGGVWTTNSRTVNHFQKLRGADYGLPFTTARADDSGRYLSSEDYDCRSGTCTAVRETYVKFEMDEGCNWIDFGCIMERNRRIVSQRVEFLDDGTYADTDHSNFDGLGHYRTTVLSGNYGAIGGFARGDRREVSVGYNPFRFTYQVDANGKRTGQYSMLPPDQPWILDTYMLSSTTEGAQTSVVESCFDATGFLARTRSYANGTSRGATDVLKVYEKDPATGYIRSEQYLGGDLAGDPATSVTASSLDTATLILCDMPLPGQDAFRYRIDHAYDAGVIRTSVHTKSDGTALPFFDVNNTQIDWSTGLVRESRDAAGVTTAFDYDKSSRLTKVTPTVGAVTTYAYNNAAGTTAANIVVTAMSADATTTVTQNKYEYDALGRLWREHRLMPGGANSVRETLYDFAGRRASVSEWGTGAPASSKTIFSDYDLAGRPGSIRTADGKETTFAYSGERLVTRTFGVARTPGTETSVSVREERDRLGRLALVTEDATGAQYKTLYQYRLGDQLALVRMLDCADKTVVNCDAANKQERTFEYDGRGYLVAEDPPESDRITYQYDARGHVRTKTIGTSVSLRFDRDRAERLARIHDAKTTRDLKVFTYDSTILPNGATVNQPGSLVRQEHNNYRSGSANPYVVRDWFEYDAAGRISRKHTAVVDPSGAETKFENVFDYTDLGLPKNLHYPTCASCPSPGSVDRAIPLSYDAGLLTKVGGITADVSGITYTPAAQVHQIQRARATMPGAAPVAGVVDTYEPDPNGMPRPHKIEISAFCENLSVGPPQVTPSGTVSPGQQVTLTASAAGATSYQWYEGVETPIAGATGVTLQFNATSTKSYWVRVGNGTCTADSVAMIVSVSGTVCGAIVTQPQSQTVPRGSSATFTIAVEAGATVQWLERTAGGDVQAGTGTTFSTPALQATRSYLARVTANANRCTQDSVVVTASITECGAGGFQISAPAMVLQNKPFTITAPAFANATYRWYSVLNGVETQIGETPGSSYEVVGITQRTGFYATVQDNACNVTPARSVTVTVDVCESPAVPVIEATVLDDDVRLRITPVDGVSYEWFEGSSYTDLSKPKGTTTEIIVPVGVRKTYWVRASRSCGALVAQSNSELMAVDAGCVPRIYIQPSHVSKMMPATGSTASLTTSVVAGPRGPFTYQWYDTTTGAIPGATGPSYTWTFTAQQSSLEQKSVYVVVRACSASVQSDTVTLTLTKTPQKVGAYDSLTVLYSTYPAKLFVSMDPAVGPDPATSRHSYTYEWYRDDGTLRGAKLSANGSEVYVDPQTIGTYWAKITGSHEPDPDANGNVSTVDYTDITVSPKMFVYDYAACELPVLRVSQSYGDVSGTSANVTFEAFLDWPGVQFEWYQGLSGDTRVPANADAGNPKRLTVSSSSLRPYWVRAKLECGAHRDSDTLWFSRDGCEPVPFNQTIASVDVAYGGSAQLSVEPIQTPPHSYTWLTEAGTFKATGETYTLSNVTASGRYYVSVRNSGCSNVPPINSFVATVRVASCPSLTPPQWQTDVWADRGTTTLLAANTGGASSYTWYRGEVGDTSNPIGGATLATYTTDPVQADAKYWVRVTGGGCLVDSPTITVHVCDAPAPATTIAYDKTIHVGQSAKMKVSMSGTNLTYQWYAGPKGTTTNPAGRGLDTYEVMPTTTKQYWVRVTAHCGGSARTWDSETFTVSVCPTITEGPTAAKSIIMPGKTTTLTITAARGDTYQWYVGQAGDTSSPVANSNNATITTRALTQPTNYWCEVRSGNCTVYSGEVLVDICPASTLYFSPSQTKVEANDYQVVEVRGAPDEPREYLWYRGAAGDTSTPFSSQAAIGVSPAQTTTYWARVTFTDTACWMDTPSLTIQVCIPQITTHPQSKMINSGATTTLSVAADLTDVTYQWYEGNAGDTTKPLAGKTTATIEVAPTTNTKYWARVTGSCTYYRDSTAADITICQEPAITNHPSNQNVGTSNSNATLNVVATGSNLTYQWYKGLTGDVSTPLTGKTTAAISFIAGSTADYWVRVSGACGAPKDSNSAKISVPPTIDSFSTGGWVASGAVKTLTVAATGNQLRYEWYKRVGTTITQIAGATATSYTTPPITADTAFFARVYSGNSGKDSAEAEFTVCQPLTLTWGSVNTKVTSGTYQVVSFNGVTAEMPHTTQWYQGTSGNTSTPLSSQENLGVSPAVTTSYWARVTMTDTECTTDTTTLTIDVCVPTITTHPQSKMINSGTTTTLTVVADLTNVTYQWYSGDSGVTTSPLAGFTTATVTVSAAGKYWARVTGSCGIHRDSTAAEITICQTPAITAQPINQNVGTSNSTASLSVTATGSSLTYQWYKGLSGDTTTPLTGKTTAAISFTAGSTADYWVKVTGACGTPVNSNSAKISVPPAISSFSTGGWVTSGAVRTLTVSATGNQLRYEWYKRVGTTITQISGATATSYTTPPITVDTAFFARVYSGNNGTDSAEALFTVCQPPALNWNSAITQTTPSRYQVLSFNGVTAEMPHTTQWYQGVAGNTSTPLSSQENLGVSPAVTTSYWVRVTMTDTGCTTDTTTLTINVCVPTITTNPAASTILDKVTNPSAFVRLTVAADISPVTYQWYIGQPGTTTSPISGATGSYYDASPSVDTTYWVRVTGSCSASKDSTAAVVTLCKAPQISSHPASVQTTAGSARTLSVTATGTDLTYQWYIGPSGTTTSPITSGTNASINVAPTQTTNYWVKVSGRCGSINSNAAKVSVPPSITTHPASGPVTLGTTKTLTVVAGGTELAYQWHQRNADGSATPLSGQTAASYTTPALNADATYFCKVSSGIAYVYSNDAVLTVCQPRTINMSAHSGVSGNNVSLTVADPVTGDSYQWYRGATGDTSALIGTANGVAVAPLGTTQYWLRTTTAGCYADSAAVTVTICIPKITAQPAGGMIASGTSKVLSVTATGTAPLTYQWYIGAKGVTTSPISGATAASYTAQPAATTTYWCRITSPSAGCYSTRHVDSEAATVQVCQPPVITSHPQPTVVSTTARTLQVTATGDGLSYQWYEGQASVTTKPVGTNANTLTIKPPATTYYWVRVTGTCGVADSQAAKVSVVPTITQQPVAGTICELGDSATFTIVATGNELTYKWIRHYWGSGGAPQVVATTQTASIPITETPVSIWCEVYSGLAYRNSDAVDVTVTGKPTIISGPYIWSQNAGWYRLRVNVPQTDYDLGVAFQWYEGALGDTTKPLAGGGYYIDVQPVTRPKTYWVRVYYPDTGCSRNGAVTIP